MTWEPESNLDGAAALDAWRLRSLGPDSLAMHGSLSLPRLDEIVSNLQGGRGEAEKGFLRKPKSRSELHFELFVILEGDRDRRAEIKGAVFELNRECAATATAASQLVEQPATHQYSE